MIGINKRGIMEAIFLPTILGKTYSLKIIDFSISSVPEKRNSLVFFIKL